MLILKKVMLFIFNFLRKFVLILIETANFERYIVQSYIIILISVTYSRSKKVKVKLNPLVSLKMYYTLNFLLIFSKLHTTRSY